MPYSAEIKRGNPGLFVFLVDQSGSMKRGWGSQPKSLSQGTADAINNLLENIVIRSTASEGVRHYFDIGLIGYGLGSKVTSALSSRSLDQMPVSVSDFADTKTEERWREVEDGTGGLVKEKIRVPVWIDPVADGNTPMCEALDRCHEMVSKWITANQSSFPPIVINITDGEATDGNPETNAEKIRNLSTSDGNVLLFNLHISPVTATTQITFPSIDDSFNDPYAKMLFRMSSPLPQVISEQAKQEGLALDNNAKGFVFNSTLTTLIKAVDIGTRKARESTAEAIETFPPLTDESTMLDVDTKPTNDGY